MNRIEGLLRKLEASERPVSRREAMQYAEQVSWKDIKEHINELAHLVFLQRMETETYERLVKLRDTPPELVFPASPNEVGKYFNKSGKTVIRWMDKLKMCPPKPGGRISITKEIFDQINDYYMTHAKY